MRQVLLHVVMQSLIFSSILLVSANAATNTHFEAIYQFGDSLSDTGNFVREPTGGNSAYNKLPYGQTIKHPTGRASDGLLIVDYIGMCHEILCISLFVFMFHTICFYSSFHSLCYIND